MGKLNSSPFCALFRTRSGRHF